MEYPRDSGDPRRPIRRGANNRIRHRPDVLSHNDASDRLRGRGIDSLRSIKTQDPAD
jgi:hypothetical protein